MPAGEAISASPRTLAFTGVPPGTMFLSQAAELDGGRVVTFFSALTGKPGQDRGGRPPAYPAAVTADEERRQRDAHWKWYADNWNTDEAVKTMEEVIAGGAGPGGLITA